MGCTSNNIQEDTSNNQHSFYEEYPNSPSTTLGIKYYKLIWKVRPEICFFQKVDEETYEKEEYQSLDELIEVSQIEEIRNIDTLIEEGNIVYYIHYPEGVIITRNYEKINYILLTKIEEVIDLCFVDISNVILVESEYFNLHEVKRQSKYYFELSGKEINFKSRNELVNMGKDEDLSETEIELNDEYEEKEKKYKFVQNINEKELLGDSKDEIENNDEDEEKLKITDSENENSNKEKNDNNTNLNNKKNENSNYNEENEEEEKSESKNLEEEEEEEEKAYEMDGDTLIISTAELNEQTNKELEKILFNSNTPREQYPFSFVGYYNDSNKKKNKKKCKDISEIIVDEDKFNDYILTYKRNSIPFEKKESSHQVKKVIFKNCNFTTQNIYYLKEFICMLQKYDFLKLAIYKNNINADFAGWKFFNQLLKENFFLRWVSFKEANFNDKIFEEIISGMTLKRIRYLNISKNKITNKGMYFLNKFLMKNQTLLILDMSNNNNVTCEGIKLIANALKMHPNIITINLSNINLNGAGRYLSNLLRDNKSLKTLLLKNDFFGEKDVENLSIELCKKTCVLKEIDLSLNAGIGNEGLKEIGKIINNNKTLVKIGLDGLNLTMNNYLPVFQAIFKNKTIESYSLNMNAGLPLKGILNFFLKNPHVKEISIIPWDTMKERDKMFNKEELLQIERFHLKSPNVIIRGINFNPA